MRNQTPGRAWRQGELAAEGHPEYGIISVYDAFLKAQLTVGENIPSVVSAPGRRTLQVYARRLREEFEPSLRWHPFANLNTAPFGDARAAELDV